MGALGGIGAQLPARKFGLNLGGPGRESRSSLLACSFRRFWPVGFG